MTKAFTSRCKEYQKYLHDHCRERQYSFQIKKCGDITCCGASRIPINQLQWLPDPVLDASNPGHFLPFHSIFQTDTTEQDRPTLNSKMYSAATSALKRKSTATVSDLSDVDRCESNVPTVLTPSTSAASGPTTTQSDEYCDTGVASLYTAQHAQAVVCCIECRKPRLVYSKQKLGSRQLYSLATQMSEHEYSCGSPASVPGLPLFGKIHMRSNLTCESRIEMPYYSATSIGRRDICCHCGQDGAVVDTELKKHFRAVLPLCESCLNAGEKPTTMRPYGKQLKKV
jgi:hypothetical protein